LGLDINSVLKFSVIDWIKDRSALKYFFVIFIFYLLVNISVGFFMYSTFMPFIGNAQPDASQSIFMIANMIVFIFVLMFVAILIASIFNYFIISKALKSKKLGAVPFSVSRWVYFVLLSIAESIAAVFCLYKLRLLLIPIAGVILSIIALVLIIVFSYSNVILSLIGVLIFLVALILFLVYFVIAIYNAYRLSLASVIYIEKERGVWDSLRMSWEITRGKVLDIFVIMLIIGIAGSIIGWFFSVPSMIYQASFTAVASDPATVFKLMVDPIALIFSLPSILVQAFFVIAQLYALIAIYSEIRANQKSSSSKPIKKAISKPKRK